MRLMSNGVPLLVGVLVMVILELVVGTEPQTTLKPRPPQCDTVKCTKPPEDLVCNKAEIKNPSLIKKLGNLRECCHAWKCKETDGSYSTYFGMVGTEEESDSDKSQSSSSSNSSTTTELPEDTPTTTTTEPHTTTTELATTSTTTKTTESPPTTTTKSPTTTTAPPKSTLLLVPAPEPKPKIVPIANKCVSGKVECKMPDGLDTCSSFTGTITTVMSFAPKTEYDACCPVYNCTNQEGNGYHMHYNLKGGEQPTTEALIKKTKGAGKGASGVGVCPGITCGVEPTPTDPNGVVCEKSTADDSERIKALGSFRECCDVYRCAIPDGSYYTHFELHATGFFVVETAFYSAISSNPATENTLEVSGDDISEPSTVPPPTPPEIVGPLPTQDITTTLAPLQRPQQRPPIQPMNQRPQPLQKPMQKPKYQLGEMKHYRVVNKDGKKITANMQGDMERYRTDYTRTKLSGTMTIEDNGQPASGQSAPGQQQVQAPAEQPQQYQEPIGGQEVIPPEQEQIPPQELGSRNNNLQQKNVNPYAQENIPQRKYPSPQKPGVNNKQSPKGIKQSIRLAPYPRGNEERNNYQRQQPQPAGMGQQGQQQPPPEIVMEQSMGYPADYESGQMQGQGQPGYQYGPPAGVPMGPPPGTVPMGPPPGTVPMGPPPGTVPMGPPPGYSGMDDQQMMLNQQMMMNEQMMMQQQTMMMNL